MRANQHSLCKPGRLCTQDHWSISFLGELHFSPVVRWKPYTLTIHLGGFLLRPWPPPPAAASLRGRSLNKPPLEHRSPQAIPESPAVIREPGRGGGLEIRPPLFSLSECAAGKHRHPVFEVLARK